MRIQALTGPHSFRTVCGTGVRFESGFLRCCLRVDTDASLPLRIGFSAPARVYGAVERNRLRRLLREAAARERGAVCAAFEKAGCSGAIVFQVRGRVDVRRVTLAIIHPRVAEVCGRVIGHLLPRRP